MANPIAFKPKSVDPKLELKRRLEVAPTEHAEALLVAYDLLQSAHDQGLLDLLNGMVTGKNFIAGKLAEYAKMPEGINGIRNLLEAAKILVNIDPELLDRLSRSVVEAHAQHKREQKPPSLWEIFRRTNSEDGRRGLSLMTLMLTGLGRATRDT